MDEKVITGTIAGLGLAWAIFAYWHSKRSALALERTKFISDNLRYFETDQFLQEANRIVSSLDTEFDVKKFLEIMALNSEAADDEAPSVKVSPALIQKCTAVDNYLNFLWRIAYAHFGLRTITVHDMDAFGYYFYLVSRDVGLMKYCVEEGFEEVLYAIKKLKPYWQEADSKNDELMKEVPKLVSEEAKKRPKNSDVSNALSVEKHRNSA